MSNFSSTAPSTGNHHGRPLGSNYDHIDAPRYEEMDVLIRERRVTSLTAAAREVAPRAYGAGNVLEDSITKRLRLGYVRSSHTT